VQVDPNSPTLKASGTKRLRLTSDEPLSNVAFNFNLRRNIEENMYHVKRWWATPDALLKDAKVGASQFSRVHQMAVANS